MFGPLDTTRQSPVILHSLGSGKNLRHNGPLLSGDGGFGKFAKFLVKPTRIPQIIRICPLINPNVNVKIGPQPGTPASCNGGQGKWANLKILKTGQGLGVVSLRCPHIPQAHIGVRGDGKMKVARKTGVGKHGQFAIMSAFLFPGARVYLESIATGTPIAFTTKNGPVPHVNKAGNRFAGVGSKWCKWTVIPAHPSTPHIVKLQHWFFKGKYLAIGPHGKTVMGAGGKWCNFYARPAGGKIVQLRSAAHMGKTGVGFGGKFVNDGRGHNVHLPIPARKVGFGKFGQFRVWSF